jgi:hypothetical protein
VSLDPTRAHPRAPPTSSRKPPGKRYEVLAPSAGETKPGRPTQRHPRAIRCVAASDQHHHRTQCECPSRGRAATLLLAPAPSGCWPYETSRDTLRIGAGPAGLCSRPRYPSANTQPRETHHFPDPPSRRDALSARSTPHPAITSISSCGNATTKACACEHARLMRWGVRVARRQPVQKAVRRGRCSQRRSCRARASCPASRTPLRARRTVTARFRRSCATVARCSKAGHRVLFAE